MSANKNAKKIVRAKNAENQTAVVEEAKKEPKVITIKAKGAIKKENATDNAKNAPQKAPEWAYWTFIPLAFVLVVGLIIFMIVSSGSVK